MASPILIYSPGGGVPPSAGFPAPAQGYLYYWPSIENLTGGMVETDLDAQNIYVLPADSLIIVITEAEGETHWLRVQDASDAVTDLEAGVIVPENYDSILRPYVLHQQDIGGGSGGGSSVSDTDITPLIEGQAYIDVVFNSEQSDTEWIFVECSVVNTVDPTPLNIWPGIVTARSITGFTLQLNGMPDSGNYELHWAISGTAVPDVPATTYTLEGPSTGFEDLESTPFTVTLSGPGMSITVPAPVTVTPSDGGDGGFFTPASVELSTASPSATFTYTPDTGGSKTISVANDGGLIDPDSLSYLSVAGTEATTYTLSGPSSGAISAASSIFTVEIGVGEFLPAPVTITPSDGGAGGTFTPTTVELSTGTPSATFTYTPSTYGAKTISTTNDGGLTDPSSVVYTSLATTYTFSGPSSGTVGVASTDFTVQLPSGGVVIGILTITPSDGGAGGTFNAPGPIEITTGSPAAVFTYTPASVGAKTLSVTNDGGLTNPGNLTYTASAGGLSDGDPVSTWPDSSGNGHDATASGTARPTFKTAIVNGKPVVRSVAGNIMDLASVVSGASPWTMFVVLKAGSGAAYSLLGNDAFTPQGPNLASDGGNFGVADRGKNYPITNIWGTGWHIYAVVSTGAGATPTVYVDGNAVTGTPVVSVNTGDWAHIAGGDGDLAEVIIYVAALGGTDRDNLRQYLAAKYAITVAGGGSAVDPSTVANLAGWWKADSL